MTEASINKQAKLSQHFTLGELTKTNMKIENVPNEAQVENLKRLCGWLEMLRSKYNGRYVNPLPTSPRGGEEEPIIINSGFRSPEVNKAKGGALNSNHLTGCAVDIRCLGIEQALRYAVILLDIADEGKGWHRQNKTSFLLVFYSLFRNFLLCEKIVSLEKPK